MNEWWILMTIAQNVPTITLVPRFILSLRELYASDLRGRQGGNIDTAFGLTSVPGYDAAASAIMFVDGVQNEGEEHGEEIQLEERVTRDSRRW